MLSKICFHVLLSKSILYCVLENLLSESVYIICLPHRVAKERVALCLLSKSVYNCLPQSIVKKSCLGPILVFHTCLDLPGLPVMLPETSTLVEPSMTCADCVELTEATSLPSFIMITDEMDAMLSAVWLTSRLPTIEPEVAVSSSWQVKVRLGLRSSIREVGELWKITLAPVPNTQRGEKYTVAV